MTSEMPATIVAISIVPNCRNPTAAVPAVTTTGPKYGIELKMPARMPHTAACSMPMDRYASHVAIATIVLVNSSISRNHSICRSMSSRICTVIFFWVSDGPTIFTSFRL